MLFAEPSAEEPERSRAEVVLILNPRDDPTFAAAARRAIGERARVSPSSLAQALRPRYPDIVVRARALSGEGNIWYVYREGRWIPSGAPG